jgi:hypothetical protein
LPAAADGDATAGDDSEIPASPKRVTCKLHFSIGGGEAPFLTDEPPEKVLTKVGAIAPTFSGRLFTVLAQAIQTDHTTGRNSN